MVSLYKCELHGTMKYGSMMYWKCRREHPLRLSKVEIKKLKKWRMVR